MKRRPPPITLGPECLTSGTLRPFRGRGHPASSATAADIAKLIAEMRRIAGVEYSSDADASGRYTLARMACENLGIEPAENRLRVLVRRWDKLHTDKNYP
jgi:hypothetical protein